MNKNQIINKNDPALRRGFLEVLLCIILIAVVYMIFTYVISVTVVQSGSMEPTLMTGNTVFYNKLSYIKKSPERGEVVLFYSDEYNEYMAKRIIGVPGDAIYFANGNVYINGQLIDESEYISDDIKTYGIIFLYNPETDETIVQGDDFFVVPDGSYFMLGDNRVNSDDSRYWDEPYIPLNKIAGKYLWQIDFSFQFDVFHQPPELPAT